MSKQNMQIIPIHKIPLISIGESIPNTILTAIKKNSITLQEGDIVVVAHTIISIAENSMYSKDNIDVSQKAHSLATANVDPKKVEVALREAECIVRSEPILITKTKHGIITDFSGIDESNAPLGFYVALPKNPNKSAKEIFEYLENELGLEIPVVICDTQGRPWRRGAVNIAIGYYGLSPFTENKGRRDLYNRELQSSLVCLVDELAAAAELVMGQADERVPVVIIRNVSYSKSTKEISIVREDQENQFL